MTITGLSVAFLQVLYLMGAKAQVPATLSFYDAANSATVVATVPLVSGASGGAVNDISIDPSILPSLSAFADFPDGNSNVVGVDFRVVSGGAISCPTDVCSGQYLYKADYCQRVDADPYALYGNDGEGDPFAPPADCALPAATTLTIRVVVEASQGSPKYVPYSAKVKFVAPPPVPAPTSAPTTTPMAAATPEPTADPTADPTREPTPNPTTTLPTPTPTPAPTSACPCDVPGGDFNNFVTGKLTFTSGADYCELNDYELIMYVQNRIIAASRFTCHPPSDVRLDEATALVCKDMLYAALSTYVDPTTDCANDNPTHSPTPLPTPKVTTPHCPCDIAGNPFNDFVTGNIKFKPEEHSCKIADKTVLMYLGPGSGIIAGGEQPPGSGTFACTPPSGTDGLDEATGLACKDLLFDALNKDVDPYTTCTPW
mmetsp:Transcript_10783/g.32434  ORF Transcript_10783/g.32434 Transcript_10783/m.32434 type:complete len:428 (-) Transcript_10783:158-1441(-)